MKSSHWILFYPSNHHHRRHTFTIYNHPNTSYSSIVCYYCDDGGMKQRYMVNTHIANDIVYMCRQQTNKKLCVQQQKNICIQHSTHKLYKIKPKIVNVENRHRIEPSDGKQKIRNPIFISVNRIYLFFWFDNNFRLIKTAVLSYYQTKNKLINKIFLPVLFL